MKNLDLPVQRAIVISLYTFVLFLIASLLVLMFLTRKKYIFKYVDNGAKRFFGSNLLYYIVKRFGSAIISLLLAVIVTFLLLRLNTNPRTFCDGAFNKFPPAERPLKCDQLLTSLGFNGSYFAQLFVFLGRVIPFPKEVCTYYLNNGQTVCTAPYWGLINFGQGFGTGDNVPGPLINEILMESAKISFQFGLIGFVLTEVLGYPFGVFMAKYKNKAFDRIGNGLIIVVFSIPTVVFFYLFKELLCLMGLPRLYTDGDFLAILAPGLIMGLGSFWSTGLWVRRYMVDEFGSDYVKFARSKGIPENTIMFKHILRNAVIPLVRSFPAAILYCLTGSFFVEKIYNIPGMGKFLVDGLSKNNFGNVQAAVVFTAFISIIASVLGDVLTALCDPRISFEAAK